MNRDTRCRHGVALGALIGTLCLGLATTARAEGADVAHLVSRWPPGPRLAAIEMHAKYGPPDDVSVERLVWRNAGPFASVAVNRSDVTGYLEHAVRLDVPLEKIGDLHIFDAGIVIYHLQGEVSARGERESDNLLTLNLAYDVIVGRKTAEEARRAFASLRALGVLGHMPAYAQSLNFRPRSTPIAG